jgi:hypothetical protein
MESGINQITPIFVFALPRSGSTLLQKIISSSDEVSTAAEPWILLPLLGMSKKEGTVSSYSHSKSCVALNDFKKALETNGKSYNKILETFITALYEGASTKKTKYFLDKTPRYYHIIDEITELFPNAKFIFLFRNPLALVASKLAARKGGVKTLYSGSNDILNGPNLLVDGYEKVKNKSIKITYSELIYDNVNVIKKINGYLNTQIDHSIVTNLSSVRLIGSMGDPKQMSNKSNIVSADSVDKWVNTFNNPIRRFVAVQYLKTIKDSYFDFMGITRNQILEKLRSSKTSYRCVLKDVYGLAYLYLNLRLKLRLLFSSKFNWFKNSEVE